MRLQIANISYVGILFIYLLLILYKILNWKLNKANLKAQTLCWIWEAIVLPTQTAPNSAVFNADNTFLNDRVSTGLPVPRVHKEWDKSHSYN